MISSDVDSVYFMVKTDTCKKMATDIRHPMASKQISMCFF